MSTKKDSQPIENPYDAWLEKYKPVGNHLDPEASFSNANEEGCMFETFGNELVHVQSQDPKNIWTLLDSDVIVAGFHVVNRAGYFVTERPWLTGEETVVLPSLAEEQEESEDEGIRL